MDNFRFYAPTEYVFGKDTEKNAGKLVRKYGGTKVLIHFGGGSVKRSGLLDRVKDSLEEENVAFVELGGVQPNPRSGLVYRGIELCKKEGVDFILAVGGGSTIDSSKAIAAGLAYEGDFWDFYSGRPIRKAFPVGTILTIAAAGSEGSPDSVITKEEGMLKRGASGNAIRPKFSILNPELLMTLPDYQSACGMTDILAHLYERYLTSTGDVSVTDHLIEGLMKTVIEEGLKVMADPKDYEARANIMWTGTVAHNNIVGVGRKQDWTSHMLEHELSAEYDCAHGAGLAVAMPAVFTYYLPRMTMRLAQAAVRVWGCEMDFEHPERTAKAGIEALKNWLHKIGMPLCFAELGAKEEDIPKMADRAYFSTDAIGVLGINREQAEEIYRLMV